ncbi:hypothetical protein ACFQPG_09485 [Sphingomonas sp. GCM10030256]|uniref:hypothetical protein n=1 Tax=Sphingomonas sp. GCM10030256 TaxID=3273427 RepID=UPI0036068E30
MKAWLAAAALLALTGCNRSATDETIDAVPEPSAASAANLMAEAERAADNAQDRLADQNAASPNQGEAR